MAPLAITAVYDVQMGTMVTDVASQIQWSLVGKQTMVKNNIHSVHWCGVGYVTFLSIMFSVLTQTFSNKIYFPFQMKKIP